jgi:translation initiation factor 2B subunit (eIF-2B alpha/beta/delta family)
MEVRAALEKDGSSTESIVRCKKEYLKRRQQECNQVASRAKAKIDSDDWLVIFGFSHAVMTLLTEQLLGHRGTILIVRAPQPSPGALAPDETLRIMEKLKASGLSYRLVDMGTLPEIFTRLRKNGQFIKVLLGTRGIFNGGDVLGAVGSSLIALAAKAHSGTVLVLAESDKRAVDRQTTEEMERLLYERADLLVSLHHQNADHWNVPVDRLTNKMYDEIIGCDLYVPASADDSV